MGTGGESGKEKLEKKKKTKKRNARRLPEKTQKEMEPGNPAGARPPSASSDRAAPPPQPLSAGAPLTSQRRRQCQSLSRATDLRHGQRNQPQRQLERTAVEEAARRRRGRQGRWGRQGRRGHRGRKRRVLQGRVRDARRRPERRAGHGRRGGYPGPRASPAPAGASASEAGLPEGFEKFSVSYSAAALGGWVKQLHRAARRRRWRALGTASRATGARTRGA